MSNPQIRFTHQGIEDYFKKHKRVRTVTIDDDKIPGVVDIYVTSWILLNQEKHILPMQEMKPMQLQVTIHNKSIFRKKVFANI